MKAEDVGLNNERDIGYETSFTVDYVTHSDRAEPFSARDEAWGDSRTVEGSRDMVNDELDRRLMEDFSGGSAKLIGKQTEVFTDGEFPEIVSSMVYGLEVDERREYLHVRVRMIPDVNPLSIEKILDGP